MPTNTQHSPTSKPFKEWIPLISFCLLFLWWWYFYQASFFLNDYGADKPDWLYLLDGIITLPLLCWFCIANKKKALLTAASLFCLVIISGSFIIPDENQTVWPWLTPLRWGFIALFAALEISAILTVAIAIKAAIDQHQDPDEACEQRIKAVLPDNKLANLLLFESRVWMSFLLGRRINPSQYRGIHHFSYHHKDGAASNALGWIMVILFEAPLMHLLLHFIWSATAANVVTGLTLLSLVFFVADYKAMRKRPISLSKNTLIVRYGLRAAFTVPLANIESIKPLPLQNKSSQHKPSAQYGRKQNLKADLNYSYDGNPNLLITLHRPIGKVSSITLGMDRPGSLISQINQAASPTHNPEAD